MARTKITPAQLNTGATTVTIATQETTTSTTYADLATVGPSATVTIGANGLALVSIKMYVFNSAANFTLATISASGANTITANDSWFQFNGTNAYEGASTLLLTGLTPGSTTFTIKYRVSGGTGSYGRRSISVIPL